MVATSQLPVIVLTGFLGSGKTTLLNRLLADPGFRDSAIVVNEFGSIGLDHALIASARENILLLDAGCLCCVMVDSLRETLADLWQRRASGAVPPFGRVVIETTGLADPAPILRTLMRDGVIAPLFKVAGLVTVVDAVLGEAQLDAYSEAVAQAAMADRLVVTKHESAASESVARLGARLGSLNPSAEVVMAPRSGKPVASLFAIDRRGIFSDKPTVARHSHGIVSESFVVAGPVTWAGISAWTGHLRERWGDDLLRTKALLPLSGGGQVLVQGVQRAFETTRADDAPLPSGQGAAVCIGRNLDSEALRRGLAWLDAPEGLALPPDPGFAPWLQRETA